MPDVLGRIDRLHHGAQHDAVDKGIERGILQRAEQILIVLGGHLGWIKFRMHACFTQEGEEVLCLFLARPLVNAVDEGHCLLCHDGRNTLICKHHKLFDHLVRDGALIVRDKDLAVFIEDFCLFDVKRNTAFCLARMF